MNILYLADNPAMTRSIELMLSDTALGFRLEIRNDGKLPRSPGEVDVLLIDDTRSVLVTQQLAEQIRKRLPQTPVVVLTDPERADLQPGAFDRARSLAVPFHRQDLLNMIEAAGASTLSDAPRSVTVGELRLDLARRTASVRDVELPLTGKEYEVLELLALRPGVTLSKDTFLNKLYGGLDEPEMKIIDVFVCKIRRKIKALSGGDPLIDTVWGRGYVLHHPENRVAHAAANNSAAG